MADKEIIVTDDNRVKIERPPMNLAEARDASGEGQGPKKPVKKRLPRPKLRPKSWKSCFNHYLPITDWVFNYNLRNDLVWDVIAGFTIAIMHIPQVSC